MARKYIKRKSAVKPITGQIVDTININDKSKNTYSARLIDTLLSEVGISETIIQTIINTAKLEAHPIGSYYWSDDPTDPSELFGGTWERVKNRFVYALGDEGNVGDTGGSETHTLTVNEMPSHTHPSSFTLPTNTDNGSSYPSDYVISGGSSGTRANKTITVTNQNTGGGAAHNNMPPYVKAYCWKRTA